MQLFELVSPRLFRPLAGPNRAFYAELLLLLWEECRHTADYSISRAEAVSRAEDYFAALAKPLTLDADGAGDEEEQPTRDPHTLALGFLLRLRRTGWLEEQPGSYESEPTLAFVPEVAPLLDALEEILNPRVVTYTGKLYKAWQLLQGVGEEKNPYENVLREVASDLEALNKSLRALNASIGHYIDRLTRNRTPQEVLELFDQYEEKVVAAAYHRFKTSDNLFNYRAYLEEGLDACEETYLPQLALDYARVERCAPGEAAPRVRALIQQQRDALEEMSNLIREIDASHIRYRKRAVQRAQFLLLSDRSSQGSVTALLRRYAEDIRTPDQPLSRMTARWPPICICTRRLPLAKSFCTRRPRPARRPRWPRCRRKRWTRISCAKSSNCCWTTPGWLSPKRTWPCWHSRHWLPARRWRHPPWRRNIRAILPASSACIPIPSRRTGTMTSGSRATGWSAAASGSRTLS